MPAFARFRLAGLGLVVLAALLALPVVALAAKPTFIHDAWDDTLPVEDFCGVPGLTVQLHSVGSGDIQIRFNQGTYAIFSDHLHFTDTWTGPNGAVVTVQVNRHGHDASVTDNGDGTYTDFWTETGISFRVIPPNGPALVARGRITLEFVYGDAGTPGDPSDDYFISFQGVVDSSGPHPEIDFCSVAVAAFTA